MDASVDRKLPTNSLAPAVFARIPVVAAALSAITVGAPFEADRLTIYPLRTQRPRPRQFVTIDEATSAGSCRITEVSAHGRVSEALVANDGNEPVLILHGEELTGAKQNRIVNVTILVPPRTSLRVPVTCVEAARWSSVSGEFIPGGRTHYGSGRRMAVEQVTCALRARRGYRTHQAAVWRDIAAKCSRMDARSPTGKSAALFERWNERLQAIRKSVPAGEYDVGAVFARDGRVAGLELTDSPDTWRRVMPKLLPSFGLDTLDESTSVAGSQPNLVPQAFVEAVRVAECESYRAIGLGRDIRLEAVDLCGAALFWNGRIVHLVAFPTESKQPWSVRGWQPWLLRRRERWA